jgi:hypothetical protein
LSVGVVVVGGVVVLVVLVVVVVVPEPPPAVVVVVVEVVVVGAVGAVKGMVSAASEARLLDGAAARLVQLRAACQACTAAAAGGPLNGCGRPARMLAGRQATLAMWRPIAVTMREPLSVSGAVSS